jgi:drug/metabolite transporter (DMT)-like permease
MAPSIRGPRGLGIAAMAGCAFLWSLAGLFIKLLDWNPFAIAGGRSAIAALFIWAWIRKPRFTFSFPQVAAALSLVATMMLFVYANKATTSANAILLQYGEPVYVAIIGSLVLKERPKAEHWIGFAFVAFGMALFFAGGIGGGSALGNIAATAAGLTFALYTIFMRMQKDGSPIESILLSHGITAVICLAASMFFPAPKLDARSLAVIAALGILQIGLASVLFAIGIKRVAALDACLVGVIEPAFNPLWVFLATREAPGANALAGGLIIIAAVVGSTVFSLRREARARPRSPSGT